MFNNNSKNINNNRFLVTRTDHFGFLF